MCTDTFLRLPEEKRNRFLQAAWEEFTTASFAEASINQIVRIARVPRGSFYQYFLDKWDLFSDLMGLIRDHFEEEFRKLSIQSDGDLFRTIPLCYDRFVQHGPAADPLFERCLRILRLNSGLFLQLMLSDPPDHHCFLESAWETLDPSALRSQEPDYVQQVFFLSLLALAAAVKDTLAAPDEVDRHRRGLQLRLEILQHGSLSLVSEHSTKEVTYA